MTATLSITKTLDTALGLEGGQNPLGQPTYREFLDTCMESGADGRFEWHVNPSTRPALTAARKTESYVLSVTGPNGAGVRRRLVVRRGQRTDLGTVVVD